MSLPYHILATATPDADPALTDEVLATFAAKATANAYLNFLTNGGRQDCYVAFVEEASAAPSQVGIPENIEAVFMGDYAEAYDHLRAIGGAEEAAVATCEAGVVDEDVAICAFCGGTAPLQRYMKRAQAIRHRAGCRQPRIAALLKRLPPPQV